MPPRKNLGDLVAHWEVALSDGVHKIEFEHGTTSGKRVVYIDGKTMINQSANSLLQYESSCGTMEVYRKEWMFKLVGFQDFVVGKQKIKGRISIDACSGFAYEYTLTIEGKSLKKFLENKSKTSKAWALHIGGVETRIVFEKDTLDVWVNGEKMETAGEFTDDGTETHFEVDKHACFIQAVTSGKRREGIVHSLYVDNRIIPD
uniref:fas apoptotic inhibitory molecule 1-like n=1 Tax=Styela clava TaxID=7725 RepID=UPI001939A626|nr:fas apoptotic inhibitory molecule 1-like [Styela clava]